MGSYQRLLPGSWQRTTYYPSQALLFGSWKGGIWEFYKNSLENRFATFYRIIKGFLSIFQQKREIKRTKKFWLLPGLNQGYLAPNADTLTTRPQLIALMWFSWNKYEIVLNGNVEYRTQTIYKVICYLSIVIWDIARIPIICEI